MKRNLPQWDLIDILNYAKSEMNNNEEELKTIILRNYQISEDLDSVESKYFYEVYESYITIDTHKTLEEFRSDMIKNEKLVKEYKTLKGLINNAIKTQKELFQYEYNIITNI